MSSKWGRRGTTGYRLPKVCRTPPVLPPPGPPPSIATLHLQWSGATSGGFFSTFNADVEPIFTGRAFTVAGVDDQGAAWSASGDLPLASSICTLTINGTFEGTDPWNGFGTGDADPGTTPWTQPPFDFASGGSGLSTGIAFFHRP